MAQIGLSLAEQYMLLRERAMRRRPQARFMAYLQSFSNTYGPASRLRTLVTELTDLPDLVGLAIGTRPDCLDEEKLDILKTAPMGEIWLDLGLQSANDRTLARINRGHDAKSFATWTQKANACGLKVCAHVITGLPGEVLADFEQTMAFVNMLPVAGIKIHNLFVCRGTALEKEWRSGTLRLLSREGSLAWLVRGLSLLRPDMVIHRLNGDPRAEELVAPGWAAEKQTFLAAVKKRLQDEDIWQGKALGHPWAEWFNLNDREGMCTS